MEMMMLFQLLSAWNGHSISRELFCEDVFAEESKILKLTSADFSDHSQDNLLLQAFMSWVYTPTYIDFGC